MYLLVFFYVFLLMQNSMLDLEQSIEPSSWSLLTISDCNLCALLSMVQTSESTKSLLAQLTAVLDQNVQHASTLEEAIEMNNNGLPEDMFKDTRSRKIKFGSTGTAAAVSGGASGSSSNGGNGGSSNKKDMEPILQAAMSNLSSDGQGGGGGGGESSKMAIDSSSGSTSGVNSNSISTPVVSTPISTPSSTVSIDSTQKALDVLSKSAHIIVCCQKPGSLSYILTVPTSTANSASSTPIPTPIPTPGRRILPSPTNGAESNSSILNKLSGLIKRTSAKCGKGSSKKAVKNPPQGELSSKVSMSDYDAEKFSKFANVLLNMDGIEGLQAEGCDNNRKEVPSDNHNQQQLRQPSAQSRVQLLTSSGSDAKFTNSLESENSVVTKRVECVEEPCNKVMDFASIVSNAVESNSEQMLVESSDHTDSDSVLPLLPEVPMSWLKIPTDAELNDHQQTSESMDASESEDVICTPTPATSSTNDTLSITIATPSVSSTTASNDATGVQITNTPLPSPSNDSQSISINLRPPPPPQLSSNSKDENHATNDHQPTIVGTQQVHANDTIDQPMAETEPHNNSSANDDFLDVSLDLDAESLKQLLALSRSPESHHSSSQKSPRLTISTDTAPLSPISQLFDSLEPAEITCPGAQLDTLDSHLPNVDSIHEHRYTDKNENPGHSHTDFNSHAHLNLNVDAQQSIASHENQDNTSFNLSNNVNSSQVEPEVPGLAHGNIIGPGDVSSTWTPSPNSLQLWLESTSGKLSYYVHVVGAPAMPLL